MLQYSHKTESTGVTANDGDAPWANKDSAFNLLRNPLPADAMRLPMQEPEAARPKKEKHKKVSCCCAAIEISSYQLSGLEV